MVDRALDELLITAVSEKTRSALVDFAERDNEQSDGASGKDGAQRERVVNVLKLVGATPEFQRA